MDNISIMLDVLQQQLFQLNHLEAVLAEELVAVSHRDGVLLLKVSEEKEQILQHLQANDKTLQKLGLQQLAQEQPKVREKCDEISLLLQQCKERNEINYHAAYQTQLAAMKVKSILFSDSDARLYNAKGSHNSGSLLGSGIKA